MIAEFCSFKVIWENDAEFSSFRIPTQTHTQTQQEQTVCLHCLCLPALPLQPVCALFSLRRLVCHLPPVTNELHNPQQSQGGLNRHRADVRLINVDGEALLESHPKPDINQFSYSPSKATSSNFCSKPCSGTGPERVQTQQCRTQAMQMDGADAGECRRRCYAETQQG